MFRTWWQKFFSFPRSRFARRRGYRPPNRLLFRTTRLSMTALEDRITPATFADNGATLNLVLNTANTNAAIVSGGASYTITLTGDTWTGTNDANVTGNGTATLTVTAAGIAAFTNQISLVDAAAAGDSVTFNNSGANLYANNFNIQLSNAAAGGITFNGNSSFGAHTLSASTTVGILINSGAAVSTTNGGITLSANEQVTPTAGNFGGIDVSGTIQSTGSGNILLQGRGGNASPAQTSPAGVNLLSNGGKVLSTGTGAVTIVGTGGSGSGSAIGVEVDGANAAVTSVSGAISITGVAGTGAGFVDDGVALLNLGQVASTGTGASAATITIDGTGGDATAGNSGVAVQDGRVTSVDGAISITGTGGSGSGTFNMGVEIDGGGGGVQATGAATITIVGTGGAGTTDNHGVLIQSSNTQVTSASGAISITGTGGAGGPTVSPAVDLVGATVTAGGSGNITLIGDSMSIDATLTINAGTGVVTLDPKTTGTNINFGGADAAGTLGLTNAELGTITAGILRIGSVTAGDVTVSAAINLQAVTQNFTIITAGGITGPGSIAVSELRLAADNAVNLPGANNLNVLAGAVGNAGQGFLFNNQNSGGLTIGTADGVNGIATNNGAVSVTATANAGNTAIAVNQNVNAGTAPVNLTADSANSSFANNAVITGGSATITADRMALGSLPNDAITVGTGSTNVVTLQPFSSGWLIDLGSTVDTTPNTLELSNAETGTVTAGTLRIGSGSAGNISITAPITFVPATVPVFSLISGGSITDANAADTISVTNLAVRSVSGVNLNTVVSHLAVRNTTSGNVTVANTGGVTLTAVDTLDGSAGNQQGNFGGGTTTFSAASPFTYAVDFTSGGTITTITADNGGVGIDNITVNPGVTVQSTGGDVIFHSGDDVDINGTVQSTFRDVDLVAGFGDTDGEGIINITGTVSAVATVALNVNATNAALPAGTPIADETASGAITAAGLLLLNAPAGAPGEFSLDSSTTNSVGTIAAAAHAEIDFQNSGALTVGAVTSTPEGIISFGILTNNHDVTLCALTGDISLTQGLNAGTGTARLAAGGAVTQTALGAITAANLGVAAGSNIGLDQAANAVPGTVALNSTGGTVAFMETDGFTVGTISASDCFPGATGITGGADITICSGLGITLTAPIDTTGTVRIQSGGSVTQTATGTITAANLGVRADGNINLCVSGAANDITGTFAADASGGPAGSSVMFLDSSGFTVGTITASGCFTTDAVGVRSNNGAVDLVNTAGSFAFIEPINAGTGTVRINSAGAVSQANNGVATITAANLAVIADGVINLCVGVSPNAVTGNFAASDSAAGAGIMFLDANGYTVGTVAGDACAAGATGAVSNNGDIDLVGFGPIALAQAVNAGTGTVRLNAAGALTQTGAGVITAQNLAAVAGGNIDLSQLANVVGGTFAALNETAGNFVRFLDADGFTVGAVAGDACAPGATGVATTAADISLVSTAGPIALLQAVSTATPNIGTVRINSGGAVTQTVGGAGAITAQNLAVVANGTVDLAEVPNTLNGTFAAADSANGAAVQFLDNDGFTVGTIAADPAALGATGVVTTNGDIDLVSTAGSITLSQAVNAGTATVRINSGAAITQSGAAGAITAANLAVVANGPVNLCVTPNTVSGNFAALDTGVGASVMFNDTVGITVGSVAGDAHATGATGVVTNNGDIDLVSTGSIAFPNSLSAGTGTVRLNAGTTIAQSGGTVTAQNLAVVADGTVDLAGVANSVPGNFAARDTGAGAAVRFLDTPGFTIGTVAADTCAAGATGVTTTNGDATLVSSTGSIQLQQAINTGAGTTRLQAATGIASTAATGTVTAASLGVNNTTSGDIQLDQANAVGVLAAVNDAAGAGINFADTIALTLDAVSADGTLFAALNNVTTTGAGGTVRLQTAGLSQTTNGIVRSDLLGVQNTAGNVILDQPNVVNTFAATNSAAGGRITLRDANSLVLGTVSSQGTFPTTNGITTNVGTTFLQAAGDVTQTAAGLVNSQVLAVNSTVGGAIRLDQGNAVATFAADEGPISGLINFRTTVGLTLDTVASGSALLPSIAGVSTRTGTTLLHAANGITQTGTGLISSATLAVRNDSAGDISLLQTNYLTSIGNQVGTFAGINGGAGGRLDFATLGALTLGTVPADGTFAQVRGITTNNGGSNLRSGTDFTAVDTNFASPFITLGSGNFLVNPGQTPVPAAMVNTVVRTVTFNAEAQTTGTFRFGVPKATDAPPPAPPINVPDQSPVPANPTGAATIPPAPDNPFRETFNIRPSSNVQILVNGNDPTTAPGDTLNLILTDLASNAAIQFTPGGVGSGRFDFPNTRKAVPFTGIETVGGLSVLASSIQTGPHTYTVTASGTLQGRVLFGGITGGQAPANPFVVSPNPVNPVAPFGAARIAFGDFNGDGIPDLILANGPANTPLVTVVNGRALFGPQHALGLSDILSQFFAYNPNFQGGMFVAAGDLNGDGRAEIVTGADQGGGPHVRVFSFNPAGADIYHNAVDYATTFANPANSPFPNGGFYAYNSAFTGGVRVAVGDVNGDGTPDIITGAGPGGGPHVEAFSGTTGKIIDSFYAFAPNFAGGVYVAAGDYNKDGKADILTGAGRGGPEVRVFSGADLSVLTQFYAFGPDGSASLFGADLGDTTGVGSVAFADVNGDGLPDIIVGSNRGPRTRIAAFLGNTINPPPHLAFTIATNPNPNLFTIDPTTGDLLTLPSFGFRDGSNVAGLFGKS